MKNAFASQLPEKISSISFVEHDGDAPGKDEIRKEQ